MWRMNCGCSNPMTDYQKIEIKFRPIISYDNVKLSNTSDRTKELKCEIIQDLYDVIDNLECGIQPDLQEILEQLSIIEMGNGQSFGISKQVYSSIKNEGDDLLRRSNYLSEFETEEERQKALNNLGIDSVRHIVLTKDEYENIDYFDKDAIYFITQ